jgi:hypothetical protein
MSLLGLRQTIVAKDADADPNATDGVSEIIPSGQTTDVDIPIPVTAAADDRFPLFNRNLYLTNGEPGPAHLAADGGGGMMTFIEIAGGAPANNPPIVDAGPNQTINFPASASLDGTVDDGGDGPGPLTTLWTVDSGPGTVAFGSASSVDTTASFSAAGTYVLRLTANDGVATAFDTVTITVNAPPTVDAGTNQTITLPASASLDGTVDDGGDGPGPLTTLWTVDSGPGTVTFGSASSVDTTASFSAAGTYVLRLTANDGVATAFDTVTITVNAASVTNKHIGDLDQSATNLLPLFDPNTWTASVTIVVHNASHSPVPGATVTGTWSSGGAPSSCTIPLFLGTSCTVSRVTSETLSSNTFTVTGVTGAVGAGPYTASLNHDPDSGAQASNGTNITVPNP